MRHTSWILRLTPVNVLKDINYLFLEEGRKKGKESSMFEKNIDQLPLTHAPSRDWACNPGMWPD